MVAIRAGNGVNVASSKIVVGMAGCFQQKSETMKCP
jgi:hypothetical protein